jgi:hypothetical protein
MPKWLGGSALNPDILLPSAEQWKLQWHRVIRWYKRTSAVKTKSLSAELDVDDIDLVIAFFQNCYHLRDWLRASRPDLSAQIDSLFSHNFEMAACRDICNGFKHKTLNNRPLDADFNLYREYDYFAKIERSGHPIKYRVAFADGDDVRKFDLFELAHGCFQLWDNFIFHDLNYTAADVSSFLF